jgi:hypothetical protein
MRQKNGDGVSREIVFNQESRTSFHTARKVNSIGFGRNIDSHYTCIKFVTSIGSSAQPQSASTTKIFRCALFNCDYTQAIEMGKVGGQAGRPAI